MAYRPLQHARTLPESVDVKSIAYDATQAAFSEIASGLYKAGFTVSGDFSPGEVIVLDQLFENFVRRMALNNEAISRMNDEVS